MKSNYKKIGAFIRRLNNRNKELETTNLLGINIDKYFMPSVANVQGTDLSKYKLVQKNQFACNRMHVGRDERLPIALSNSDKSFIVSPAYDVFEIENEEELLPEYLMMWFSRKEFDRNTWFYTDSDVRGKLGWEDFLNMELPVPSIEKQRAIVQEYSTIVDRIQLNEELNQKLEETAQALYKHWFVDFEFPNEHGLPYKSNGGKMVWNGELEREIPKEWYVKELKDIIVKMNQGVNTTTENVQYAEKGVKVIRAKNINKNFINYSEVTYVDELTFQRIRADCKPEKNDILYTNIGSKLGNASLYNSGYKSIIAWNVLRMRVDFNYIFPEYLILFLNDFHNKQLIKNLNSSSTMPFVSGSRLGQIKLLIPDIKKSNEFQNIFSWFYKYLYSKRKENETLEKLKKVILSKMSKSQLQSSIK